VTLAQISREFRNDKNKYELCKVSLLLKVTRRAMYVQHNIAARSLKHFAVVEKHYELNALSASVFLP
jgi:hypothetical protein